MSQNQPSIARDVVFISKATPGDDEFVLWLAPRLEAAGYSVFADVLSLEGGDRWRKVVTDTLQNKTIKMLLCCRDSSLEKNGVQEEIGIAEDIIREIKDPRFIIPLRLEKFKKVFGIGELQYVDFVGSWAVGLSDLLETLASQQVVRTSSKIHINPNWENYKKRYAINIEKSEEVLSTNWLRISSLPETIRYYQPSGALNHAIMEKSCQASTFPTKVYQRGFFSFAAPHEIEKDFANAGKFIVVSEQNLSEFLENGSQSPEVHHYETKKIFSWMLSKSWENYCRSKGFYEYAFSNHQLAYHVSEAQMPLGKRISWGQQAQRRNSMLRNSSAGKVWQYGVSASPFFWPFPHFRIKSRVLFAELTSNKAGSVFKDSEQQHLLRRRVCKGWRNKAWHGRMMAFLQLLSGNSDFIEILPMLKLDATPILVTSPVTTALPNVMSDDAEERDASTLGNFDIEVDD